MSEATDMLGEGLVELQNQLGQSFTFNGIAFTALPATPQETTQSSLFERGFAFGPEHDFVLAVNVGDAAFAGGLPQSGDIIAKGTTYFPVEGVRHAPGAHVAFILCRQPSP